jgi:hypothetical protein
MSDSQIGADKGRLLSVTARSFGSLVPELPNNAARIVECVPTSVGPGNPPRYKPTPYGAFSHSPPRPPARGPSD